MHIRQNRTLLFMNAFYRQLAVITVSALLALVTAGWLAAESGSLKSQQDQYQALDAGLTDLRALHDVQRDIESAYRGTLMTGSGKALELLRTGRQRWQLALEKTQASLGASPAGRSDVDTLAERMTAYFANLEKLLQDFRGGGALADLDSPAVSTAAGNPYETLEQKLAQHRSALASELESRSQRIRYLAIGMLLASLTFIVSTATVLNSARRKVKALQETLAREMVHDPLTGLANRRYLHAWLQAQISSASRMGDSFHVLYLDLDGFERINEQYGQDTGDEILVAAAQRLKTTTRGGDFVARQTDDEFVIVFSCEPDSREIGRFAARLIRSLGKQMVDKVPGGILSASIGVANYPADGATADDLVVAARKAMLQAKRAGKACYAYRRETAPSNEAHVWEVSRF